jgi:hypothetical protein
MTPAELGAGVAGALPSHDAAVEQGCGHGWGHCGVQQVVTGS